MYRPDLKEDHNENKHYFIAKRCIEKGGRRDIFLGVRECQGYVIPYNFMDGTGYYDNMGKMEFGLQYHSISYPDENGKGKMIANFWLPKMEDGIINFCRPEECYKKHLIREMKAKQFNEVNFSGTAEAGLLDGYKAHGGV
jgi:CRISPR-associated protein Cas5d